MAKKVKRPMHGAANRGDTAEGAMSMAMKAMKGGVKKAAGKKGKG